MVSKRNRAQWRRAVAKWQRLLLLKDYALTLEYDDTTPDGALYKVPSEAWRWSARAEVKPEYLQACIVVNSAFLEGGITGEIEETARHELVHVVLGRVDNFVNELLRELPGGKRAGFVAWWHEVHEFTTEHLARVTSNLSTGC